MEQEKVCQDQHKHKNFTRSFGCDIYIYIKKI